MSLESLIRGVKLLKTLEELEELRVFDLKNKELDTKAMKRYIEFVERVGRRHNLDFSKVSLSTALQKIVDMVGDEVKYLRNEDGENLD